MRLSPSFSSPPERFCFVGTKKSSPRSCSHVVGAKFLANSNEKLLCRTIRAIMVDTFSHLE